MKHQHNTGSFSPALPSSQHALWRPILLINARAAVVFIVLLLMVDAAWSEISFVGKVVSVQDGDTLTIVDEGSRQVRIRVAGIDAPEKDQPYGFVSTTHLAELTLHRLAAAECAKVDRYGRNVCTVWVNDVDVGLAQLRAGLAWHYKKYASEQPANQRNAYAAAEDSARTMIIGIWLRSDAIAPWDWRRRIAVETAQ